MTARLIKVLTASRRHTWTIMFDRARLDSLEYFDTEELAVNNAFEFAKKISVTLTLA